MDIQKCIGMLFSEYLTTHSLSLTYKKDPVELIELIDNAGFLPLIARQAKLLSDVCDASGGYMRGLEILPEEMSITGERVSIDAAAISDKKGFLLFMLEALVVAKDKSLAGEVDLAHIVTPVLPDIFEKLGITTPKPIETFSEPQKGLSA